MMQPPCRQAAGVDVQPDVPPVVARRCRRQPDLPDDLAIEMQRVLGRAPVGHVQLRQRHGLVAANATLPRGPPSRSFPGEQIAFNGPASPAARPRRSAGTPDARKPSRTPKCPAPWLPPSRAVVAAMHGHLGTLSLRPEAGRSFRAGVLVLVG